MTVLGSDASNQQLGLDLFSSILLLAPAFRSLELFLYLPSSTSFWKPGIISKEEEEAATCALEWTGVAVLSSCPNSGFDTTKKEDSERWNVFQTSVLGRMITCIW